MNIKYYWTEFCNSWNVSHLLIKFWTLKNYFNYVGLTRLFQSFEAFKEKCKPEDLPWRASLQRKASSGHASCNISAWTPEDGTTCMRMPSRTEAVHRWMGGTHPATFRNLYNVICALRNPEETQALIIWDMIYLTPTRESPGIVGTHYSTHNRSMTSVHILSKHRLPSVSLMNILFTLSRQLCSSSSSNLFSLSRQLLLIHSRVDMRLSFISLLYLLSINLSQCKFACETVCDKWKKFGCQFLPVCMRHWKFKFDWINQPNYTGLCA